MNETSKIKIGKRIARIRKMRGESQIDLGRILNVKEGTISKYERGVIDMSITSVNAICDHYSIDQTWLLTGKGNVFKKDIDLEPLQLLTLLMNADDSEVEALRKLLNKIAERL